MMLIEIVANEKKGYVKVNDNDPIVCPLVKDREDKYSLNVKKLGYARSFISVGALEDKTLELDEATLSQARMTTKRGPKVITVEDGGYLSVGELEQLDELLNKINAGYAEDFAKAQAEKAAKKAGKTPLTEEQKIERQIAKLMAKKEALLSPDDEVVED